jgi:hypothetical protein
LAALTSSRLSASAANAEDSDSAQATAKQLFITDVGMVLLLFPQE